MAYAPAQQAIVAVALTGDGSAEATVHHLLRALKAHESERLLGLEARAARAFCVVDQCDTQYTGVVSPPSTVSTAPLTKLAA